MSQRDVAALSSFFPSLLLASSRSSTRRFLLFYLWIIGFHWQRKSSVPPGRPELCMRLCRSSLIDFCIVCLCERVREWEREWERGCTWKSPVHLTAIPTLRHHITVNLLPKLYQVLMCSFNSTIPPRTFSTTYTAWTQLLLVVFMLFNIKGKYWITQQEWGKD